MTDQIKIEPCAFCGGPPCISVKEYVTGEDVAHDRPQDEECSESYDAHIWCHECGAQGPMINTCSLSIFERIYDLTVADTIRIAIERWNVRHQNNLHVYEANAAQGHNVFEWSPK